MQIPDRPSALGDSQRAEPELRAAVLIVGSLWWEDYQHRTRWRRERLQETRARLVRSPIRYGRRSRGRDDTYTMVFSTLVQRSDYGMGTAMVVPCRHPVRTAEDLVEEARHLWVAESSNGSPTRHLSADWGAVGVRFAHTVGNRVRSGWAERVAQEEYPCLDSLSSEAAPIAKDGTLAGRWPTTFDGDELQDLDLILATANLPTLDHDGRRRYPTAREIAAAWLDRRDGEERYFFHNVKAGIRTFQDLAIWQLLAESEAADGFRTRYPKAVAKLEQEASNARPTR